MRDSEPKRNKVKTEVGLGLYALKVEEEAVSQDRHPAQEAKKRQKLSLFWNPQRNTAFLTLGLAP